MATWIDVMATGELADGAHQCRKVLDQMLVICRVGEQYHAVSNVCPHAGLPLGDGELRGCVLTCPYHGYAYRLSDGANIDYPEHEPPVPVYPVRIHEGRVEVSLDVRE